MYQFPFRVIITSRLAGGILYTASQLADHCLQEARLPCPLVRRSHGEVCRHPHQGAAIQPYHHAGDIYQRPTLAHLRNGRFCCQAVRALRRIDVHGLVIPGIWKRLQYAVVFIKTATYADQSDNPLLRDLSY